MKFVKINNELVADWVFSDFKTALKFINLVGDLAEIHDHHPQIINNYNKVQLRLTTHDAGNIITEKDILLANEIEKIEISII